MNEMRAEQKREGASEKENKNSKNTIISELMMEKKQKNQQSNDFWMKQNERKVQIVVEASAIKLLTRSFGRVRFLSSRTLQFS